METLLQGIAAVPGIAFGTALVIISNAETLSYSEGAFHVDREVAQLDQAIVTADEGLARVEAQLRRMAKPADADIFAAHRMLLADPLLRDQAVDLIANGHRASVAIVAAGEEQATALEALGDTYLSSRATDVRDIVNQVRRLLTGDLTLGDRLDHPAIVVAHDLGPSELMSAPQTNLLGIALAGGGLTAHATILARTMQIPMIVGLGETLFQHIDTGVALALDGSAGQLLVHPSRPTEERLHATARVRAQRIDLLRTRRNHPTVTRDGRPILLKANAATPNEARAATEWGAAGIGLVRTELLFLGHASLPNEAEQLALYTAVANEMDGKPVVIRTLDAGGDKQLLAFPLPKEENPFLGWRGIRIGLSHPEILMPQFRALLRAGATHTIRIMLPMVTTISEFRQARLLLETAHAQLMREGLPCTTEPKLGIMIEVPAAALAADHLAREADFFSIGSNDLTQYTLACERLNPNIAALYQPLEPAVLRLIAMTAEAAHRHGKPVALCGEMAGDPNLTALLIGLGIDELSCAPPSIPEVREAIIMTDDTKARQLANEARAAITPTDVRQLITTYS